MIGTDNQDIRWKQHFQNYEKAFGRLARAIEVVKATPDDNLLQSGLVQTYEYTFELALKTLRVERLCIAFSSRDNPPRIYERIYSQSQ